MAVLLQNLEYASRRAVAGASRGTRRDSDANAIALDMHTLVGQRNDNSNGTRRGSLRMPCKFAWLQLVDFLYDLLRQEPFRQKRRTSGGRGKGQYTAAGYGIGFTVVWHIHFLIFEERKRDPYNTDIHSQKLVI